ncbi:MAG: CDP-glucose 4,6-dehydratase [Granulosicoccus sp.]|nr:CDP-glucose 4,6-dehydratase [Granulosicoccus sp.]
MNKSFWTDRRVLLTGHTGFKGSWLALWLSQMGARVSGYALAPDTDPSLYQLARVDELVDSTLGDIRDRDALENTVQRTQPEIVLHLAAQAMVRESYADPTGTFDTNVMGTVNLLEATRQCASARAVMIITSDKCYQNQEWEWGYREIDSLGGHDPYSASKACAELVARSWRLSFMGQGGQDTRRCAVATARAGNVIGGGDWARDRLVPDILRSIDNGQDVVLRNPQAVRPWQHVLEPLSGYLLLAERLYSEGAPWDQAWNFGPADSDARCVSWIAEHLMRECNSDSRWKLESGTLAHETQQLRLDCSRARQRLGWIPRWTLEQCLQEIVRWHSAWLNGRDMQCFSQETIARYSEKTDP